MDFGLQGKVALVTGAGSQKGFGKAIALTLAREGCDVIVSDIDLKGAQQTADEIKASGRKTVAVKADISSITEVNAMVKTALAEFGKIDILVNNAGAIHALKPFIETTESEMNDDINVNLKGAMNCAKAVVNQMISRKSGKIINISSIGAKKGKARTAAYGAAKAGVIGLTQCLAVELAPLGINVNGIAPGMGLTNFGGGSPSPAMLEKARTDIPTKRTTTPQDIANMVAFLASDVSSDIVGQIISVDGGESII
jgi:NAD(P)-dependent dehydrogenase (short-subunit alcohol dehydrogenase family)